MITEGTYVEDLVRDHPETAAILTRRGVVCIQCGEPVWGTLGEALERAEIKEKEDLIAQLNEAVDLNR